MTTFLYLHMLTKNLTILTKPQFLLTIRRNAEKSQRWYYKT